MANQTLYKLRNASTGMFWNGNSYRPMWSKIGKEFRSRKAIDAAIETLVMYQNRANRSSGAVAIPPDWSIDEIVVIHQPNGSTQVDDIAFHANIREHLQTKYHYSYRYFYDTMRQKGVMDNIKFIFKLAPGTHNGVTNHYTTMDDIKDARAALRLIGIKTRTFREYQGMFGMMDRDQAFKARLSLNVSEFIDVDAIREAVRLDMKTAKVIKF